MCSAPSGASVSHASLPQGTSQDKEGRSAPGGWGGGCGTLSGHDMAVVFTESQQLGLLAQKRPVQEQANQHSSMDGRESLEAPLLALTATDGRGGVCFLQRCGPWSDAPTSVNNTHAAETNR